MALLALFNEIVLNAEHREPIIKQMEIKNLAFILAQQFHANWLPNCSGFMIKQLFFVQCWTLMKYQKLMHTITDSTDARAVNMIRELRRIAFKGDNMVAGMGVGLPKHRHAEDFKILGNNF